MKSSNITESRLSHTALLAVALVVVASAVSADGTDLPTFSRDIAPIFQASCQECHHPGTIAPMSLMTYEEVRPWAKSIRKAVGERTMPPWHADPAHGNFANDRSLSEEQIATIVRWAEQGAPEGDPADLPKPLTFTDGWLMGEPDAIFMMPTEYDVPADIEDDHKVFMVPTGLIEDKWIEAIEVRPGNPEVVHHIIAAPLGGWVPGAAPKIFEPGVGRLLKAGSTIAMQMHYHKEAGVAMKDRSMIGVKFAKNPIRKEARGTVIIDFTFRIPPGADSHPVSKDYTFEHDAHLRSMMPHMHLRGKSAKYTAIFPDGREEVLLNVPAYDYNWQTTYEFAEPVALPKGTKVVVEATFDNSEGNPSNPDPTKTIGWGRETTDEMFFMTMEFTLDEEDLVAGKTVDFDQRRGILGNIGRGGGGGERAGRLARLREQFRSGEASGDGLAFMADKLDSDGDGGLTRDELPERASRFFDALDTDGDGTISDEELQNRPRLRPR